MTRSSSPWRTRQFFELGTSGIRTFAKPKCRYLRHQARAAEGPASTADFDSTEIRNLRLKILVTGAAGFIGFHTAKLLLERGDEVVGLDNLNEYYDVTLKHARLAILKGQPKRSSSSSSTSPTATVWLSYLPPRDSNESSTSVRKPACATASRTRCVHRQQRPRHDDACSKAAATTVSSISCSPRRAPCTARTRKCRSRCTRTSTIRCRSTRPPRRATS